MVISTIISYNHKEETVIAVLKEAMDRLECDRMFIAVMETGSFASAAQRLGASSGQASKLISRLETDLGVRLLNSDDALRLADGGGSSLLRTAAPAH